MKATHLALALSAACAPKHNVGNDLKIPDVALELQMSRLSLKEGLRGIFDETIRNGDRVTGCDVFVDVESWTDKNLSENDLNLLYFVHVKDDICVTRMVRFLNDEFKKNDLNCSASTLLQSDFPLAPPNTNPINVYCSGLQVSIISEEL